MDKVFCPECEAELTSVYAARSVELQREGEKWIEKNVFSVAFSCPHCYTELDDETLQKLGLMEYK